MNVKFSAIGQIRPILGQRDSIRIMVSIIVTSSVKKFQNRIIILWLLFVILLIKIIIRVNALN